MATSDNWGQGSKNNDNGWGKGASNNSNGWGAIHAGSYGHPTTNLTGEGGFVGLLDLYPNAAFATGMILLRADYSGGLLRIIAYDGASQQGAADIMPYKIGDNYWVDFNSKLENLDATAIARGLTTNDTLADLCSVGVNNYDGLVPSWYDQSLNANHATQTNISNMPKLVDAGVLVEENGKPSLSLNGSQWYDTPVPFNGNKAVYTLCNLDSSGPNFQIVIGSDNSARRILIWSNIDDYLYQFYSGEITLIQPDNSYAGDFQSLITITKNHTVNTNRLFINGSESNYKNRQTTTDYNGDIQLFTENSGSINMVGRSQSVIIYPSDDLTNRVAIESNINNAYNIY